MPVVGSRLVAVAAIYLAVNKAGYVKLIFALPALSVVTSLKPKNVSPSPLPEGSAASLENNSMRKLVLAAAVNSPVITVLLLPRNADNKLG